MSMTIRWLALGEATDASCWRPLEQFAAIVADRADLPPVEPDDFLYCAVATRDDLPTLHVYRHLITQKYLSIDASGGLWRYVGAASAKTARFTEIGGVAEALDRAELGRGEVLAARTRRGRRKPGWVPPARADRPEPGSASSSDALAAETGADLAEAAPAEAADDLGDGASGEGSQGGASDE